MIKIYPLVLAGGIGTRLWPLSRETYPKQFCKLAGEQSLFQETSKRLVGSESVKFEKQTILTRDDFRFIVKNQLEDIGVNDSSIMLEPTGRNTAPAILAATLQIMKEDSEAIILASPADHLIPDKEEFNKAINKAFDAISLGKIITFGVVPTRAETGYGYLQVDQKEEGEILELKSFIEKPNKVLAQEMLEANNFLWNSGIFLFKAKDIIKEYSLFQKKMLIDVTSALSLSKRDLGFLRLDKTTWEKLPQISVDYAIMEKSKSLAVVPLKQDWNDLGDWESLWEAQNPDQNGVVTSNNATSIECENVLLRSEGLNQKLVGIGLKDLIAVSMPDAVLIVNKNKAQKVGSVVAQLKKEGISQATNSPKDHRPWGWFEVIEISKNYQVKKIVVNSGAALSLQSHNHRSEHWVVVKGIAEVTLAGDIKTLETGESIYIPMGAKHRLANKGNDQLVLIEVQIGGYLGEDDITRYEDDYSRD